MKLTFLVAAMAAFPLTFALQDEPGAERGPKVGEPAPTIRLNDHAGNAVALDGSSKRWMVLAFFPKAMTGG